MGLTPRYFPLGARHWMPGPQYELGHPAAGTTCIEVDDELPEYLAAKRDAAAAGLAGPFRAPGVEDDERRVLQWLGETVRREHPAAGDRVEGRPTLDALLLELQEDLVIMRRPAGAAAADATAAYLHVSFPSGWCPACACGQSFLEIHQPVPALHRFEERHRVNLARNLFHATLKTSVRFVWTLTPDARLDQRRCVRAVHRAAVQPPSWDAAETAYLRVERQVIVPLGEVSSVFLIRVYRHDVRRLTREQRGLLRANVAAMEDALARYKGFLGSSEKIEALLAR